MTHDKMLFDVAELVVSDAYECALNIWGFRLTVAGRYQDHARELLRLLVGLREMGDDEAREMRIVWECLVTSRLNWYRANEG